MPLRPGASRVAGHHGVSVTSRMTLLLRPGPQWVETVPGAFIQKRAKQSIHFHTSVSIYFFPFPAFLILFLVIV